MKTKEEKDLFIEGIKNLKMHNTLFLFQIALFTSTLFYLPAWLLFIHFVTKFFSYGIFLYLLFIISISLPLILGYIFIQKYKPMLLLKKLTKDKIFSAIEDVSFLSAARFSEINTLQKLINLDSHKKGLDNKLIIEIKDSLRNISETIGEYSLLFKILQKQKKYCFIFRDPLAYLNYVDSLIITERRELINSIQIIKNDIQNWTTHHQKELLEVEQELEKQAATTENLTGQGAIDLQRVRLHDHIENLDKIRNTL